jgi:hypothetical protein
MTITLRNTKGLALTYTELDENFIDLDGRVDTLESASAKLPANSVSAFGLTLIDDANDAAARTTLGLATVAATGAYSDLSGTPAAYVLPTSTTSVLGGVKIDGTTITIDGSGVISSSSGSAYVLPTATTSTLGGVKIDGTTITISSGVISSGQFLEIDGGNAFTVESTGDIEIDGGGA